MEKKILNVIKKLLSKRNPKSFVTLLQTFFYKVGHINDRFMEYAKNLILSTQNDLVMLQALFTEGVSIHWRLGVCIMMNVKFHCN